MHNSERKEKLVINPQQENLTISIGVDFYVCCNNCNTLDSSCYGTTYHSASKQTYCDKCGVDNFQRKWEIERRF
jgi:hypothetical protein